MFLKINNEQSQKETEKTISGKNVLKRIYYLEIKFVEGKDLCSENYKILLKQT